MKTTLINEKNFIKNYSRFWGKKIMKITLVTAGKKVSSWRLYKNYACFCPKMFNDVS